MKNKKISTVKVIIMVACATLAILSAIMVAFLDDFIDYDYSPRYWDSRNLSHFGDIKPTDKDRVHFGGANWYAHEITNDNKTNDDFGSLVRLYSYYNNDINHKFYGENVGLWVYDIEPKLTELSISRDSLYSLLFNTYSSDTTNWWKPSRAFKPFLALTSGPLFAFSTDKSDVSEFDERFVIFANDRIYYFRIINDELKSENFEGDIFQVFDERCLEIVSKIDFSTYQKWEAEYNNNKALGLKMSKWRRILLSMVLLFLSLVLITPIKKLGKLNIQARNLFIYGTICFVISVVICLGYIWFNEPSYGINENAENMRLALVAVGVGFLYTIMMAFLSYRSNENYYKEYLIPSWVINTFNIKSVVGKRFLLVVLFFPLFYLFPIPIIGMTVLFYILPVSVIVLFVLGIKWIVDGRSVQTPSTTNSSIINKETTMYCRHCGKIIDADSGFCRYCGKKL